jgi:nitrite reductase (NO-forming)
MQLPCDRNDRIMLVAASGLVGLGLVIGAQQIGRNVPSELVTMSAEARSYVSQPARGPVPHAHTLTKTVKSDGPVSIVRDPTDLPPPVVKRAPRRVKVDLETTEIVGKLADGASYRYWTFNSKVPGPFVRVRVGDTVEVRLKITPTAR